MANYTIYRTSNVDGTDEVILALNINCTYNPTNAINKINEDIPENILENGADDILNESHVDLKYHPTQVINEYENMKDDLQRPIVLFNFETKQDSGFPFIEAFDYNLSSDMFNITITQNLNELTVNTKEKVYKYKPIFLQKID